MLRSKLKEKQPALIFCDKYGEDGFKHATKGRSAILAVYAAALGQYRDACHKLTCGNVAPCSSRISFERFRSTIKNPFDRKKQRPLYSTHL